MSLDHEFIKFLLLDSIIPKAKSDLATLALKKKNPLEITVRLQVTTVLTKHAR